MAKRKKKCDEVWWMANGHSSYSRQPSFAPPTARPVVTTNFYSFGWNSKKACFVTTQRHGILSPTSTRDHPCDSIVALGILRRCAYKNVLSRFFDNPYAEDNDMDIFATAGNMFGISLDKCYRGSSYSMNAEASLHFYAPDGALQSVNLHNGMTSSFYHSIRGMHVAEIRELMQ